MSKIFSIIVTLVLIFSIQLNSVSAEDGALGITSEAVVLMDLETGAVLYNKNGDEKLYPASLTKIATAIYAIENGKLDDVVTVSSRAVSEEGTKVYLEAGEKVVLKNLIQGTLINSGNDAAVAIAEHIDGSVEQFSENLNKYLREKVGVKNTHFTNPNGLFDENHYTTAKDLALITNYAKKNSIFSEIFGTKELAWNGESWKTTLITHHRILKGEIPLAGVTGGKTGFVNESKHTLATTAENENIKLTAIVLKSDNNKTAYNDTVKLIEYGFTNFHHRTINQKEGFTSNDKLFYPLKDLTITENNNGSEVRVSESGVLEVTNNGEVIQAISLQEKVPKKQKKTTENKQEQTKQSSISLIYGIMIFTLTGLLLSLRKRIVKNSNND